MSVSVLDEVVAGRAPGVLPLTVTQLHRMLDQGILSDGEPVELLDGVLVRKDRGDSEQGMTHGARHAKAVKRIARLDRLLDGRGAHLQAQLPVTLSEHDEPEPDAAVLTGKLEDYSDRLPAGEDVLVVLEVADSSLEHDRSTKMRLYAASAIAQYCLMNLRDDCVEVYERPLPIERRYERMTIRRRGETVHLALGPEAGLDVAVDDLLP